MQVVSDLVPARIQTAKLRELYKHWDQLRGERQAPPRSSLHPSDMPKLLPYICLVEVLSEPTRFKFRLVGTVVVDYYGEEMTGRLLQDLDLNDHSRQIRSDYREAIQSCTPVLEAYHFTKNSGQWLNYERILLPLSEDGITVNMLLTGVCPLSLANGT